MTLHPTLLVPLLERENAELAELAATEGARRNIAMAHIIRNRDTPLRITTLGDELRSTRLALLQLVRAVQCSADSDYVAGLADDLASEFDL